MNQKIRTFGLFLALLGAAVFATHAGHAADHNPSSHDCVLCHTVTTGASHAPSVATPSLLETAAVFFTSLITERAAVSTLPPSRAPPAHQHTSTTII